MQAVSEEWKKLIYKTLWDRTSIRIKMFVSTQISDYIDHNNIVLVGNDSSSDIEEVLNEEISYMPYFNTQTCGSVLNGSYVSESSIGFVGSSLSGANCVYGSYPSITIPFTENQTVLNNITITWSSVFYEYAHSFNVSLYNDNLLVKTVSITDNNRIKSSVAINNAEDSFNKVILEIVEWSLPYHKARVENIYFGEVYEFDNSKIISFSHEQSGNLLSFEKSKNSVNFTLYNDGEWKPFDTSSRYYYLQERQKIVVEYGFLFNGNSQMIKCGTFLLSSWQNNSSNNTISFSARDKMEYMDNEFVLDNIQFPISYLTLLQEVFRQCGISQNEYQITSVSMLGTISINSSSGVTCGEMLQLIANACNCIFYQNRNGIIIVKQVDYSVLPESQYFLPRFSILEAEEISTSKELRYVNVNNGLGTSTSHKTTGEIQTVENPLIPNNSIAVSVADWIKTVLENKNTISVYFRGDLLLDLFDYITIESQYGELTLYITDIKYTYNGSFSGYLEGRII